VVYYWIKHGQLDARQDHRGRWCVPFSVEVKETCRQWLLASTRIKPRILDFAAGGAVLSHGPDRTGSFCPTGGDAGFAEAVGPDVFR
jgi:hypothetical protein